MIRKAILTIGAGMALAAHPAIAQEKTPDAEAIAMMQEMFKAEPLTPEQAERLPLARTIVGKMMPEGSLGEMMGSMFDGVLKPIMEMAGEAPRADVAKQIGLEASDLSAMEEGELAELANLLDPVREERNRRIAGVMPQIMADIMGVMEPSMRKAMAEAYAVHFDEVELSDIDAFFSTESGLSFARKSFTMASDPRIIAGSMEAMPALFESFARIEEQMALATADLPKPKVHSQLTAPERARITELLGWDEAGLKQSMEWAEQMQAEAESAKAAAAE